jgi:hypothetical protein
MSTVATLLVRVAGDTKDAEKAFAGLERAGQGLERTYKGLGTRLSGVGGDLAKGLGSSLSGIEKAAGQAFGALDQGLGKVGQALTPIASMLPGLPGPVSALAGAFGGFVPVAGVLGGVGVALGALGGIAVGIVGGLVALGKSAANAGDEMLVLSQQTGISVENLSRFKYVEQQTDASVDKIVGSIRKLGTNLVAGSKETSKAIESIGLSLADVKKLKPEDAFVAIVDGLGKIPSAAQRAHAGAAIFGKGWHDVSQLAAEDLRGLMKEADLFGATMSTELAVAGDRFNDTLGQLSTVFEGFTRAAGAGVLPVLTAFAEVLRDQVIVQLQATGTTTATVQGTFETFAITVATTMLQVTASVARAVAAIATLFSKPIVSDSLLYREFQRLLRVVSVLNGIKLDTLDTVSKGSQAAAEALTRAAEQMEKDLPGALARIKAEIAAAAAAMKDGQGAATGYGSALSAAGQKLNDLVATLSGAPIVARAHEMMQALAVLTARGLKPTAEGARAIVGALEALEAVTGKMPAAMHKVRLALQEPLKVRPVVQRFYADLTRAIKGGTGLLASRELTFTPMVAIDTRALTQTIVRDLRSIELGAVMAEWGHTIQTQMSGIFGSMFSGQTGLREGLGQMFGEVNRYASSALRSMADTIGTEFADVFKGGTFDLKNIFSGEASAAGIAAGAAVGASVGLAFGRGFGKAAGIALGATSGALAGGMFGGPWGAAAGAAVGAIAGWWGGKTKEKEQRAALEQARDEMQTAFGSVQKLEVAAKRLGISWDALWQTKDTIRFQAALKKLNLGLAEEKELLKGLTEGLGDVSAAGTLISKDLFEQIKTRRDVPGQKEAVFAFMETQQKAAIEGLDAFLSNAKIKTQAGATAISASLAGIYQSLVAGGASPTAAFRQMEPALAKLQAQLTASGLAGVEAFGPLGALATLAADAIGGPMMDAMAGLTQGLTATANLGLLNTETFAGFAAEMLAGFKQMEALGQGGEVALAGMQGGLQKLWEISTDFGYSLGADEQAMIDFALASGTIGERFRPAADRMANAIDALVDRMDKFLATFEAMPGAANTAAGGVEDAFRRMRVPPVEIPFVPTWQEGYTPHGYTPPGAPGTTTIPALGTGGIVRRPTVALIGEKGPEAVVPLSKDFGSSTDVTLMLDSEVLTRAVLRKQPRILRAYGAAR